jgi:CRISPR/Cas system-associated exonuclease Cas4 (RecB family)
MILPAAEPDYLPARMLNEFVYCPRLFYYEWVEGQFRDNAETVEGTLGHRRVDQGRGALAPAEDLSAEGDSIHARSVQLSSEQHRLIAKMDLIESQGTTVTPVDYKRGAPRQSPETGELMAWDADRVQVAARDDLRPLHLSTQGLVVGKSGQVLKIKKKDKVVQEVRIGEVCQLKPQKMKQKKGATLGPLRFDRACKRKLTLTVIGGNRRSDTLPTLY